MRSISTQEAQKDFARVLDESQIAPVLIRSGSKEIGAIVSIADYEHLRRAKAAELLELCHSIGEEAQANGMTEEILKEILRDE